MKKFPLESDAILSEMSCKPINSYTFTGTVTVNDAETQQYSGDGLPISHLWTSCAIRQGNQLTIQTTTPLGIFSNTVRYQNEWIKGTLTFGPVKVTVNGKGTFQ